MIDLYGSTLATYFKTNIDQQQPNTQISLSDGREMTRK